MIYFGDFDAASAGIQYVGGKTADGAVTSYTVSLTDLTGGLASAPAAGDIVIVTHCLAGSSDFNMEVTTSGYVEVADIYSADTYATNLGVFYKVMGGTPDTDVTLTSSGTSTWGRCVSIHVWRGVDTTTPMDVTATTATGANSGQPNPPAITPTTGGAVIVVAGGAADTSSITLTSSLDNFRTETNDPGTFAASVGLGSVSWTGGSYDPPAWGGVVSSFASWAAVTMALRPA